jgi:hypothetical protein
MADLVETLEQQRVLTRRAFTLDAALALLAGCVITISDACGSSSPTPVTPTPTPVDVTGVVSANHGHTAVITGAQITAGNAVALNIQGTSSHPHTLSISQSDLQTLKNRQAISSASSTDSGHSHTVTFTPA